MKVLLLEKIKKLGNIGDLVDVKDGYARNYLFTRKKALRFTKENEERFEAEKEIIEKANVEKNSVSKLRTINIVMQICKNKKRTFLDINSKMMIISNESKNNAIVPTNKTLELVYKTGGATSKRLTVDV